MAHDKLHLIKIKQRFRGETLQNISDTVKAELPKLAPAIRPGSRIAIAVGSRGIRNIAEIVAETGRFVRSLDASPLIVPAMGSHGEANADTQAEILAGYGISEQQTGIPVRSSMDVVELPEGNSPVPVFMDRNAWESDGVILVNRIKPHTDFHARYESGLVKMTLIGLGKEKQASTIHSYGVYGLSELLPVAAGEILKSGRIIGGLAIVENGSDDTMVIKALRYDEFLDEEPALLKIARQNMPFLPFDEADLLIVDRMGKDISGVGLDPNIIGRIRITGQAEPDTPRIKSIMVSDLTGESHGNAIGIGLADVITRRLYDKIDFRSMYINGITSSFLERVKVPLVAGSEREAFTIALRSCGYIPAGREKIARIRDTLSLGELYVSGPLLKSLRPSADCEILENDSPLFTKDGHMADF